MGKRLRRLADRIDASLERRLNEGEGVRFELKVFMVKGPSLPFASYKFEGVTFRTGPNVLGPGVRIVAEYQTTPRWALLHRLEKVPEGLTAEIDNGAILGTRGSVTLEGPPLDYMGRRMRDIKSNPEVCWAQTKAVRDYLARNLRA